MCINTARYNVRNDDGKLVYGLNGAVGLNNCVKINYNEKTFLLSAQCTKNDQVTVVNATINVLEN